jgi:hypothetical protein
MLRAHGAASERQKLGAYLSSLLQVRQELRLLAIQVSRSIRALEEELSAAETDHILGLVDD